jgi:ABC-type multidrug transport system ATPase subunit
MSLPNQWAAVLDVDDAQCTVSRLRVFSGLTFTIRPGERVHLGGVNGAGKTTVLRCIGGTMSLDRGHISVGGSAAGSKRARILTGMCVNPEQGLHLHMSGHDNLMFAGRLRMPAARVRDAVTQVETELGISPFAGKSAQHYSAGMRARVTVARALLGHPPLLLMDEPTRSLDDEGRELFWAALNRRPEAACLIASHLPDDRLRCDRSIGLTGPAG